MKVYQAVVGYLGAFVSAFQYVFSKTINRTRPNGLNEPTFISVVPAYSNVSLTLSMYVLNLLLKYR